MEPLAHNNSSFREHLNSIQSFYDCDEKVSSLLPLNDLLEYPNDEKYLLEDCEEALRKLDEVCINSDSSKCPSSTEKDSEKPRMSPDFADVSDCSSSKQNKNSSFRIKKSNSFNLEHSDHPIVTLESSSLERGEIPPMSPERILSPLYPDFDRPPISIETSPRESCSFFDVGIYGMISSPISSSYINLANSQSSQDHSNSNTLLSPTVENSESSKNLRGLFSRSCEFPTSSKHNIHCTKYCQQLKTCSTPKSSIRKTDEAFPPPNSETLHGNFSSSCELPRTSNRIDFCKQHFGRCNTDFCGNCRQSTACPGSNSTNRNECASALSDLPKTSTETVKRYSDDYFCKRISRSARKLVFDEPDTSSEDSIKAVPIVKELRKRKKTKRLPDSSKIDVDANVSKNEYSSSSSSEDSPRKSLKFDETACASNTRSVRIANSEENERHHSSRKRLISRSKASSDIEKSDTEKKRYKKFKKSPSSD